MALTGWSRRPLDARLLPDRLGDEFHPELVSALPVKRSSAAGRASPGSVADGIVKSVCGQLTKARAIVR